MARKRAKVGDVIRIATANGYAYAQFTRRDPLLGCMIRVLPGLYPEPLTDLAAKVSERELYHTLLFEDDLHEAPVVTVAGNEPVPEWCRAYPLFRTGLRDPRTGRVATWWLWDGTKEWPIGMLTEEQRSLSLRQVWTYNILADRVARSWMPVDDC